MSTAFNTFEIEGLVLKTVPYKEKDAIVYLAGKEGIFSVFCKGVFSTASKNHRLTNPFSEVKLQVRQNRDSLNLINGSLIHFFYNIQDNLEASAICFILNESLGLNQISETVYDHLKASWQGFQSDFETGVFQAFLCLAEIIKLNGWAPNVEECVLCGSRKKIQTMSLEDGGFLCSACRELKPAWKKRRLMLYRRLFHEGSEKIDEDLLFKEPFDWLREFEYLCYWFEYHSGLRLKSLQFFKSLKELGDKPEAEQSDHESAADIA